MLQRRHKDLLGAAGEIAASITRPVRSETRDLVGRPCVPTPVAPLNNTTQPRVHLCMRARCLCESLCESCAKCGMIFFFDFKRSHQRLSKLFPILKTSLFIFKFRSLFTGRRYNNFDKSVIILQSASYLSAVMKL